MINVRGVVNFFEISFLTIAAFLSIGITIFMDTATII